MESKTWSRDKCYFVFENSKCPEYVTENQNMNIHKHVGDNRPVPIVMLPNTSWYEKHIPNMLFIHVDDFYTPDKMGLHLKTLGVNSGNVLEYLNGGNNINLIVTSILIDADCVILF